MIDYWPITLDSTESKSTIWLETRSSLRKGRAEYLDLYIVCSSSTLETVKYESNVDFHSGTNEGFDNTIFRTPALRTDLENMAREIISKISEAQTHSAALELVFPYVQNNMSKLILLVLRAEGQSTYSFQVTYVKDEFRSVFQIRTSAERILSFMRELIGKIIHTQ